MNKKPADTDTDVRAEALRHMALGYERMVQTLSLLCELDHIEARSRATGALARDILQCLATGLAAQNCSLYLIDSEIPTLRMVAAWSPADEIEKPGADPLPQRHFSLGQGITGIVAQSGTPIRLDDAPNHPDYVALPDSQVKIRSLLCYPLRTEGRVAGVLNLSHSQAAFFNADHEHLLALLADRAAAILLSHFLSQRLRESESHYRQLAVQLKQSLQEKETLLREVHHRVKNNLQLVSSMLDLQTYAVGSAETREVIEEARRRVRAMALVHERLYLHDNIEEVDFAEYIGALIEYLSASYGAGVAHVHFDVHAQSQPLQLETAVPFGLILNELLVNALKHAFPDGRRGVIRVEIRPDGDRLAVSVQDDGVGLPESVNIAAPETLGLQIVVMLTRQIAGALTVERLATGTLFTVRFPSSSRTPETIA